MFMDRDGTTLRNDETRMKLYCDQADQDWLLDSLEDHQGHGADYDRNFTRAIGARFAHGAVVVAFNGFNGIEVELHLGGTGQWGSREFLRTFFTYIYHELPVRRLTCKVESDNLRPIKLAQRLGFNIEGVQKQGGRNGRDLILLGQTYDECPWVPKHMWRENHLLRAA